MKVTYDLSAKATSFATRGKAEEIAAELRDSLEASSADELEVDLMVVRVTHLHLPRS